MTSAGEEVLARSVRNDEASVGRLIDDAAMHGTVASVIDTTRGVCGPCHHARQACTARSLR